MNRPNKLIVHHTGGTNNNPLADTSDQTFEIVDAYHRSLGWGKIGYHYFIEKDGKITQGRLDTEVGAHTIGQNDSSLGICLAGNFDLTIPTIAQTSALKQLLIQKMDAFNIPSSKIFPHRVFAKKTCYGHRLGDMWASGLVGDESMLKLQLELRVLQLRLKIAQLLGLTK